MSLFLVLQNTYQVVELALVKQNQIIDQVTLDKTVASQQLVLALDSLLKKHNYKLSDLNFIAVNQGPGPFTTLRVVIATVNGLAFATKIPLVGVDGLDALLAAYTTKDGVVVALLNAFHHDVYYGIKGSLKGYDNIDHLLQTYAQQFSREQITFIGNGAILYKEKILEHFGERASFEMQEYATLATIAEQGLALFKQGKVSSQLMPLYLKKAFYTK